MNRLFVDTSAWVGFVNRREADHDAIRAVLSEYAGRLVTTNHVFDESVTLCRARLGHACAVSLGEVLRESKVVDLVRVTARDEEAAWLLFRERSDQGYSFTDCVSFAVMKRLGLRTAVTLDAHFRAEGYEAVPA